MISTLLLVAAIALPPKPDHYVTDRAGVLDAARAKALNEKLADFERQTSDQILVYIDQRLPADTTIDEMASEAVHKWGVGQKGKDNGAVLFVFVADRKMRIEVGYGLEGALTDAKSKHITSTVIKPEFQRGDFAAGVEKGVDAMLTTIRGEPYKGTGKTVVESKQVSAGVAFAAVAVTCLLPLAFIALVVWLIVRYGKRLPRAAASAATTTTTTTTTFDSSDSSSSSSSSSDSSSSSSDSSSSFDGGGGDSGGGGSSDSW